MAAGNNITLPDDLLAEVARAAAAEHRIAESLVQEAVEQHLLRKRLQSLYARGESHARKAEIPESSVDAIVKEERRERAKLAQ